MSLQDELRRLGIDLPKDRLPDGEPTDGEQLVEVLRLFLAEAFWTKPSFEIEDAFDVYVFLDRQVAHLGHKLAEKGVRAITTNDRLAPLRERDVIQMLGGPPQRGPCHHIRVRADVDADRLRCRDCGKAVNPMWWLSSYASTLARAEDWLEHTKRERKKLAVEIEELKKERSTHKAAIRRVNKKR